MGQEGTVRNNNMKEEKDKNMAVTQRENFKSKNTGTSKRMTDNLVETMGKSIVTEILTSLTNVSIEGKRIAIKERQKSIIP